MSRSRVAEKTGAEQRTGQTRRLARERYVFRTIYTDVYRIKPLITSAVIAKVYEMSKGNVVFDSKKKEFVAPFFAPSIYELLSTKVNTAIERRVVELAKQLAKEKLEKEKEYEVIIDLDDRFEQLLQEAYREFEKEYEERSRLRRNEKELYKFFEETVEPMLWVPKYKEIVRSYIDKLKHYDDIEEAKEKLIEIADSVKDEDRELYEKELYEKLKLNVRLKKIKEENKALKQYAEELSDRIVMLKEKIEKLEEINRVLREEVEKEKEIEVEEEEMEIETEEEVEEVEEEEIIEEIEEEEIDRYRIKPS